MRAILVVLGLSLAACAKEAPAGGGGGKPGQKGPPAFPVEVATVAAVPVEYAVSAVGTVEAFEVVSVTARVAGVVEEVRFREGQAVKAGDALVEIDPDRYSLAVSAASTAKEKAAVSLADAEAGLSRRESASGSSPGLIPAEELETWRTKARSAKVDQEAAEVALSQARLNLRDARVRAPISGVIESRQVSTGQYVQPGTVLATLLQREPLLLRFKVPERDAARLSESMPVRFWLRGDESPKSAVIQSIAGAADPSSRLVSVVAEINDPSRDTLRPGSFAEVRISIGAKEAPVIPETAVRPSGKGFLAFVIQDGVADERVLELGMRTEDGQVEVVSGLSLGESLVIRGAEALRDGAKVRVAGDKPGKGKSAGAPSSTATSTATSAPASAPAGGPR